MNCRFDEWNPWKQKCNQNLRTNLNLLWRIRIRQNEGCYLELKSIHPLKGPRYPAAKTHNMAQIKGQPARQYKCEITFYQKQKRYASAGLI